MEDATLEPLLQAMEQKLGRHLHGAYHFPATGEGYFVHGHAANRLLLIIEDYSLLHTMRQMVLEAIATRSVLPHAFAPFVATRRSLLRHLALNPLFARHLARTGRRLTGPGLLDFPAPASHQAEQVAYLAAQAVHGSASLAPEKLSADLASLAYLDLCRLAALFDRRVEENQPPAADLFFLVQTRLDRLLSQITDGRQRRPVPPRQDGALPLEALYEDRASLLVVIPPGSGKKIRTFNWASLVQRMPDHLSRLAVSTAEQLRLTTQSERPLDYVLGTYRHIWGQQPLNGMAVTAWAVFRQAARKPSELLVDSLPGNYLVAQSAEDVHSIIHDYQNRLLNIRLEQELLNRIFGPHLPGIELQPPGPLPKRDEPLDVRIDAIVEQLDWWAAQYSGHMKSEAASQKLTPL